MTKNENIIVFCAHSDDQIFGPGGTLAKYAKAGKKIHTYIFSYGEMTHPHLKREIIVKMRVDEAKRADKFINGCGVNFLGLAEGKFAKQAKEKNTIKKLINIIETKKPKAIFTHNSDDPHIDHRDVNKLTLTAYDKSKHKCDVYAYDVWSPITLTYRNNPKLVVDISNTFGIKINALKIFKSQIVAMIILLWSVYAKAIKNGLLHGFKFAEVFYKVR